MRWPHPIGVSAGHLYAATGQFSYPFHGRHFRARGLLFLRIIEGVVSAPPTTMPELIKAPSPHPVRMPH